MLWNQSFNPQQCAAQSVGTANQLFSSLVQTLLAVHCSISPPKMWPMDYGEIALKRGSFKTSKINAQYPNVNSLKLFEY